MIVLKRALRRADQPPRRAPDATSSASWFLLAFLIWVTGFDIARILGGGTTERRPMTSPDALRPRRRPTVSVDVGGVLVGSAHPVVVQSMTNTDTADADATAIQVARLAHAGSQLVRDHGQQRGGRGGRPGDAAQAPTTSASTCPSSATSTTTATSCWSSTRRWPRRSRSTGSTRATSARSVTTRTSRRSSGSRSRTTSRSGSASTGARSTRRC